MFERVWGTPIAGNYVYRYLSRVDESGENRNIVLGFQ